VKYLCQLCPIHCCYSGGPHSTCWSDYPRHSWTNQIRNEWF